jgi:hypothetical protein
MNGAKGEPWLTTVSTPTKTMIITMGNSQYRFLARRNCQNSTRIDIVFLKLSLQRFRVGHYMVARDPVAI